MLDIKRLRDDPDALKAAFTAKKEKRADVDGILALDEERRTLQTENDELLHERKKVSKEVGQRKRAGEPSDELEARSKEIGGRIGEIEGRLKDVVAELDEKLLWLPNPAADDVPVGTSEDDNAFKEEWGEKRTFDFEAKDHLALGAGLELFEAEGGRGVKIAGSNFVLFTGTGARLVRALINLMLDTHTTEHGYKEVWPPLVVNPETMRATGQLPKLADDMYHCERDDLYLIPTAEVPVTNIHRDEILERAQLPIYYTAYTPCFRREAGAYSAANRGLQRVHQFDKVELVKLVEPQTSAEEHEKLLGDAKTILERLGLAYRVVTLCTGDLSFAANKCWDIEAWAPGAQRYYEVSSVSNFTDFQARRARIRYRDEKRKARFVHTLNGSGLALPRVILCLLETYQRPDGSVTVPEVLRPYLGGMEAIEAPKKA